MDTEQINKAIESCVGIMGEKAYQGSYAAPREAFQKILKGLLASLFSDIREKIREKSHCEPHRMEMIVDLADVLSLLQDPNK